MVHEFRMDQFFGEVEVASPVDLFESPPSEPLFVFFLQHCLVSRREYARSQHARPLVKATIGTNQAVATAGAITQYGDYFRPARWEAFAARSRMANPHRTGVTAQPARRAVVPPDQQRWWPVRVSQLGWARLKVRSLRWHEDHAPAASLVEAGGDQVRSRRCSAASPAAVKTSATTVRTSIGVSANSAPVITLGTWWNGLSWLAIQ